MSRNNLEKDRQSSIIGSNNRDIIDDNKGNEALHRNALAGNPQAEKGMDWVGGLLGTVEAAGLVFGSLQKEQYNDALKRAQAGDYSIQGGWLGFRNTQQKAQDTVKGELAGQQSFDELYNKSKEINGQLEQDHKDKPSSWKVNQHNIRLEKAINAFVSSKKSPEYVAAFLKKARIGGNKIAQDNLRAYIAADKKTYIDNTTAIIRKSLGTIDPNSSDTERTAKVQENLKELKRRIKVGGFSEYDYKIAEQRLVLEHARHTEGGTDFLREMQGKEGGKWITNNHIKQTEKLELANVEITERRKRVTQNVNYSSVQESIVKTELALDAAADMTDPAKKGEALTKLGKENNKRLLALRGAPSGTYSAEQYDYLSKRAQAIKDTISSGGVMPQMPQEALTRLRQLQFDSSPEASVEMKQIFIGHAGKQLPKDLNHVRSFTLNRTEQERKGKEQAKWNSMSLNLLNNIKEMKESDVYPGKARKWRKEATQYMSELVAEAKESSGNILTTEAEKEIREKFAVKFPPKTEEQKVRAESFVNVKKVLSDKAFEVQHLSSEQAETIKTANPRELQELKAHYIKEGHSEKGWKILALKAGRDSKNLSDEKKLVVDALRKGNYYSSTKQLLESQHTYTVAPKTFGIDTLNPHIPVEMQKVFIEDAQGKHSLISFKDKGQEDKVLTSPFTEDTKVLVWEKAKSKKLLGFIPAGGTKAGYKIKLMKDITPEEIEQLNSVKLETFPFDANKPRYNQNSLSRVERDKVPRRAYHNRPIGIDPQILTLNLSSASLPLKDHYVVLEIEGTELQGARWTVQPLSSISDEHKKNIISNPFDPNLIMAYETNKDFLGKEKKVGKLIDIFKSGFKSTLLSAKPLTYMKGRELHKFINPEHFK